MTTFKNLKAVFSASGATPYGDASTHILKIYNTKDNLIDTKSFDTRYEGITTDLVKWCVYWCDYINAHYIEKNLSLISYHANEEALKNA